MNIGRRLNQARSMPSRSPVGGEMVGVVITQMPAIFSCNTKS